MDAQRQRAAKRVDQRFSCARPCAHSTAARRCGLPPAPTEGPLRQGQHAPPAHTAPIDRRQSPRGGARDGRQLAASRLAPRDLAQWHESTLGRALRRAARDARSRLAPPSLGARSLVALRTRSRGDAPGQGVPGGVAADGVAPIPGAIGGHERVCLPPHLLSSPSQAMSWSVGRLPASRSAGGSCQPYAARRATLESRAECPHRRSGT